MKLPDFKTREEYKHAHSVRSAKITSDLLKKYKYDNETIRRVVKLIEQHEIGTEGDEKILTEADSLAFFQRHLHHYYKRFDLERTKKKIQYMYNRLSRPTQQIVIKIKFPKDLKEIVDKTLKGQ